jgi:Domain of unknown function (DUF4365)
MSGRTGARQNPLQGDFGECWLAAVAAGCGILHSPATTVDLEKADLELVLLGDHRGSYHPTVKVQVKTTRISELRRSSDGFSYDLDRETYDALRRTDHVVRRILVVIWVEAPGGCIRLNDDGTLLVGFGAWVSLEGCPPSENSTSQVVNLPESNTLDGPGLEKMLMTYGVRRTTDVPDFDAWGAS